MANQKYDGVIEAVHYSADGQVDWVRAYLRRGSTWADHVILKRQELVKLIKSGKRVMIGKRVEYMGGTFEVSRPALLVGAPGKERLVVSPTSGEHDNLEGAPLL